jgi:acyl-CoA reductase-like NAD-dependent aldehyde dehydrogenase
MAQATAALFRYDKNGPLLQQPVQCPQSNIPARVHSVPPHIENQSIDKRNEMSSRSNWSFLRSPSVPSAKVRNTAERVQFALQAWGKMRPAPIKQIQHIAEVDQKTASAWYHGKQPPRADHLFTLALHIPELKAEIARLLELEQDGAASFQREAIALLQRYAR